MNSCCFWKWKVTVWPWIENALLYVRFFKTTNHCCCECFSLTSDISLTSQARKPTALQLLYINKMFLSSYAMQQCIYCTYPSIPLAEINVIYALIVHGLVVYRNICRKYEALLVSCHSTVMKDAINERKARLGAHIPVVLNQSHEQHCTITKQYKL